MSKNFDLSKKFALPDTLLKSKTTVLGEYANFHQSEFNIKLFLQFSYTIVNNQILPIIELSYWSHKCKLKIF